MEIQNTTITYADNKFLEKTTNTNLEKHIEYDENGTGFKELYDELKSCDNAKTILRLLVHELPALNHKVLLLKFWENLDDAEIAYNVGTTKKRVKKILEESYILLRRKLLQELYDVVSDDSQQNELKQ